MSELRRTKIVAGFLLEWRAFQIKPSRWVTTVSVYKGEDGNWKRALSVNGDSADKLQRALREAVLEIEAAMEKDTEAEAVESAEQDPFPAGDPPESTLGD